MTHKADTYIMSFRCADKYWYIRVFAKRMCFYVGKCLQRVACDIALNFYMTFKHIKYLLETEMDRYWRYASN